MAPPSPTDPRRPGFLAWTLLAAICAAVIGAEMVMARQSVDFNMEGPLPKVSPSAYYQEEPYNLLERGLEKGHLYLDKAVPPGLARLPNPYDSGANNKYRNRGGVFDLSYYGGRLYLYFGITPALTAFLPWHLLTGHYLSEWLSVAGFGAAGFLASTCLLLGLWRRHFPAVGVGYVAAGVLMLATTTTVPLIVARPRFWEVPISCSYAFLMAGILAGWLACRRGRWRAAGLAATGLCAGLAVGARPSVLPSALALTAAAALGAAWVEPDPGRTRRQALVRAAAAAFLPLAAVGVGLGIYNFERFGDFLQFGQHYQLSSDNVHGRPTFSLLFIPDNLLLYGLSALRWGRHFPFAWTPDTRSLSPDHGIVEFVVGILPNLPVLLLAFAAPLAWRGRKDPDARLLRGLAGTLAALFVIQASVLGLFYGICNRYEVDFLPFLVLLACLGLFGVVRALEPARPRSRRAFAAAFGALCAYSCAAVCCAALAWGQFNRWWNLAQVFLNGPHPGEAIPACREEILLSNGNRGYTDLGIAELCTGRVAEAIRDLQRGTRQDPNDWIGETNLGIALSDAGDLVGALYHFREANRIAPGYLQTEFNLGAALLSIRKLDEAAEHLAEAVRRDPEDPSTRRLLGNTYLLKGRTAEAVEQLRIFLDESPGSAAAEDEFGVAVLQAGFVQEGIRHFEAALRLDPGYAQAREHIALAMKSEVPPKKGGSLATQPK